MARLGKVAIPDAIMSKPGSLDPAEWAIVRQHRSSVSNPPCCAWTQPRRQARSPSHERYDGTGYPEGRAGSEIPLASRIVAVCDAFDAMSAAPVPARNDRRSSDRGAARLRRDEFDPKVVEAFCALRVEEPAHPALQLVESAR